MYPLFYAKMMGVNLSRLSLGAAMLAMALLASGCASTPSHFESDLAKAQQGDVDAQYLVSIGYSGGYRVQKNEKKALYWMRKAAEQGLKDAQNALGVLYKNGEGVKRDYKKAIYWYRKAAEQGLKDAQNALGVLYKNGEGVKRDYKKAIYWYRKAAEQGLKDAQNALGVLYKNGEGVKRDYKKAIYWYRKAADQGYKVAQYNLGALYKNGEGVKRDYKKAIYWYRKAAERGDQNAQNALFNLIKERITRGDKRMLREQIVAANGQDEVAKASKAMLEELLQSGVFIVAEEFANQGRSDAQFMMGQAYRLGRGVKKNAGLAIFWYKKAAEQGSLKAEAEIAKLAN